jgi:hypothetical protein
MLAAACFTGCQSSGFKKGDATAARMRDGTREVRTESRSLELVVQRLDELVNHPATDLKPQFERYCDALDQLRASAERTDKAAWRTQKESQEYFEVWNEEIDRMNFGTIRDRSDARRTAVSNQVETVLQRYRETQSVVQPVIAYFEDIRKALSADLTLEGLEVVKDLASKNSENTRKLQTALQILTEELANSSARLSTFAAAQPRAEGPLKQTGTPDGERAEAAP